MSKSSVKSQQNNSLDQSLINQQHLQQNHHRNKNNAERLKKKLKLQEMRCNLMSNEMTKLKNMLSVKKRQLRLCEKRAKREEKKRQDEEKKLKDMEKEFLRLKKENDEIKEKSACALINKIPISEPEASSSNSTINISSSSTSSSVPSLSLAATGKKRNKKLKAKVELSSDPSSRLESTTDEEAKKNMNLLPSSSNDWKINEGASCSGVNTCSNSNVLSSSLVEQIVPNSKLEDLFENELMCSICHELYIKPVALTCSHIFCLFCIEQWRNKSHRCPICRKTILGTAPQNILENVIEKVVITMDDESQKRRADVVKDRPTSTERFSRNDGFPGRRLFLSNLSAWNGFGEIENSSDSDSISHSDSSSSRRHGIETFPPFPAYDVFNDDRSRSSLSTLESSNIGHDDSNFDEFFQGFLGYLAENGHSLDDEDEDDYDEDNDDDDDDDDEDEDDDDDDDDEDSEAADDMDDEDDEDEDESLSDSETYDIDDRSDSSIEALNDFSNYDEDNYYPSPITIDSGSSAYSDSFDGSSLMEDEDGDHDDSGSDSASNSADSISFDYL